MAREKYIWRLKFRQKSLIGNQNSSKSCKLATIREKKDKREKFIDPCSNIYTKINTCHISFLPSTLKEEVWWLNINWFKMLWKSLIPIFQLTCYGTWFVSGLSNFVANWFCFLTLEFLRSLSLDRYYNLLISKGVNVPGWQIIVTRVI